jgi:hypothetical protein
MDLMDSDAAAAAAGAKVMPDEGRGLASPSEVQAPDSAEIASPAEDHVPPPPEGSQFARVVAESPPGPLEIPIPPDIDSEIEQFSRDASAHASQLSED